MMRPFRPRLRAGLALAVGLGLAAHAQQQQQPPPTFRGGARYVRVDVYPTDRDGKPIEGLTAADFQVFEDGKPQAVDTFEFVKIEPETETLRVDPNSQREGEEWAKDPRARVFVFVLDTRHVDLASSRAMRRPLTDMVDRLIGARDVFGVITPQLPVSSLLLGRRALTTGDMMERYWTWGTNDHIAAQDQREEYLEACFGLLTRSATTEMLIQRHREQQTLQHLDALIAKLGGIREERKSIVVVTQGWRLLGADHDFSRRLPASMPGVGNQGGRLVLGEPGNTGKADRSQCVRMATELVEWDARDFFRRLLTKAQQSNVSFYPVDPGGLRVFDTPISRGMAAQRSPLKESLRVVSRGDGMRELANNTDGIPLIMNNDLSKQFQRLGDTLSAYYLLGYYSENTKFDGRYRRIEVKVTKPGVQVRARRGYFAPTTEELEKAAAAREAASRPPSAEAVMLSDALGRLEQVRHDRDLFLQAVRVAGGVVVGVELGVNARQSPAWANGGEVRVTVTSGGTGANELAESKTLEPMRSGLVFRIPQADAGELKITARARGAAASESNAADGTIRIPAAAGASLIGEPISYRGIARALVPASDGRYRRTERATVDATLAAGVVPAGARLLDRTGKPLNVPITAKEKIDAAGVRWISAELSLAPLTEGDYVIEIEAMKDEQRERKLFAIRVVR